MKYRKKLIEVALPLAAINAESAREKSIRHGHPSTLHLWWARRPLAACRAVLFSSLVDDPDSDPQYCKPDGSVDEDAAGIKRADLFNLIEELVMWENSNNESVIRTARAEIARCVASRLIETGVLKKETVIGEKTTAYHLVTRGHCRPIPMGLDSKVGRVRFSFDVSALPPAEVVNAFLIEHAPPVLDPFAGGGSIPLEAQRLGLRAYASDLNPVPVLINKALIEIPPKFAGRPPVNPDSRAGLSAAKGKGTKTKKVVEHDWPGATGLAEDVRYYGQWMRDEAEKRIGHLYPKVEVTAEMAQVRPDLVPCVGQRLTVIAWLWARTVRCPNPACGVMTPLVGSFNLSSRASNQAYVVTNVDQRSLRISFSVCVDGGKIPQGTVTRNGARCVCCSGSISFEHIRNEGAAGRIRQQLLAIVGEGPSGRVFLSPTVEHERAANCEHSDFAETSLPEQGLGFRVQRYGITTHRQLFTARQLVALCTLADITDELHVLVQRHAVLAGVEATNQPMSDGGSGTRAYADGCNR